MPPVAHRPGAAARPRLVACRHVRQLPRPAAAASAGGAPPAAPRRRAALAAAAAAAAALAFPARPAAAAPSLIPLPPAAATVVRAAFDAEAGKAKSAVLLRLAFHDAAPFDAASTSGGANGSIQFELDRPENFGLKRGWRVVDAARARAAKAGVALSAADAVALGGAYAVAVTGGPVIDVPIGRIDATGPDPPGRLPSESSTPAELVAAFALKGLSSRDLVALSGAHTLGAKGFGDPVTFDGAYYKTLLAAPWAAAGATEMDSHIGLPSDKALPTSAALRPMIEEYAADEGKFFTDFAASYIKMTRLGW